MDICYCLQAFCLCTGRKGLHGDWLETSIEYKGYRYDAVAIKPDGTIYLVDHNAHAIFYESTGEKTTNEIIFARINELM